MRQKRLRRLLELTEEILEDSRQQQWESVIEKEQQRRKTMEELFHHAPSEQEAPMIEETVRQIVALNKKIITMAESGKLEILKKMRNLSAGQQAIDAYADNSG